MFRILLVALAVTPSFSAVGHAENCKQSYGPWNQKVIKGDVYYFCRYRFEPQPGREVSNYVLWIPTDDDSRYFYYSNPKGKIWCRNANAFHKEHRAKQPRWQVIAAAENKKRRLSQVPTNAWGKMTHPICPGSDRNGQKGCPMLKPPPAPLDLYAKFVAAQKKLAQKKLAPK